MSIKDFILRLVGRAPPPLEKPLAADLAPMEPDRLAAVLDCLQTWAVPHVTLLLGEDPDAADLVAGVEQAVARGLGVTVRGRGSDLAQEPLLADLAAAGATGVEILFLSAVAETHDALAGGGDQRCALRAMDVARSKSLREVALAPLVASTWRTIDHTLEFLADRGIERARLFALVCPDEEPAIWAVGASELIQAAGWAYTSGVQNGMHVDWCPPQRFDPAHTLAEQVRRGPRAGGERSLRIEADGAVLPPRGPHRGVANLLTDAWESLSADEAFRALWQPAHAVKRCPACPGLEQCSRGCLRDAALWASAPEPPSLRSLRK